MEAFEKDKVSAPAETDNEFQLRLKHDINNQLSNILLALEQLRYEVTNPTEDCIFFLDSIGLGAENITSILKEVKDKRAEA